MSIAGVGASIQELLEHTYKAGGPLVGDDSGDLDEGAQLDFKVVNASSISANMSSVVTLFFYRVEVDSTRRHVTGVALDGGGLRQRTLALNLRFLLTAWADDAAVEQENLQFCIETLEKTPVLSGHLLHHQYGWPDDLSLKVSIDSMSNEDLMRIWDSLEVPYRLSVPYLVRTVPVASSARPSGELVRSQTTLTEPR